MKSARSPNKKKSPSKNNPPLQSSAIGTDTPIVETAEPKIKHKASITTSGIPTVHPFPVVAIGASAGGLEAVTQLLQNLAPDTGMAFIYVQHLSPDHKSLLTPLLSKATKMKVQDIDDMEKIQPDNVYIIPYNKEIEVIDGHIQLLPRPANKSSNLSIDVLFSSLAETHGENVVGVVLSGSASDGTRGLKEIKLAGGITFAQDDSAKFSSMPNSAIAEGVVDFVLSPKEIAEQLGWMSKHPLANPKAIKVLPEDDIENTDPHLKTILQLLHKTKRVDFSHYKMNTIKRRMLRRMLIQKIGTIGEYADSLVLKNGEAELLYQDLLINVTEFFRDAEAFEFLKTTVLPQLLNSKTSGETLRIWVAACATGEEAFSIAMILYELQEKKAAFVPFQIFASDLSAEAISEARAGEYAVHQLKNISPKRLQQFFVKTNDKYRISKSLRDVCVFAHHNLLGDPPFSRMDFISCRNLLIYLDLAAQKKAIATFHYALNEGGCLMLGKSETIGTANDLFTPHDKKFRIYSRKKNSGMARIPEIGSRISQTVFHDKEGGTTASPKKLPASANSQLTNAFDTVLLAQFVPASVIVNHDMDILQFRGNTAPYLQNAPGKASFNILKMAHLEITFELRNAIHHAIKTKQTVRKTGIEMNRDLVVNTVRIVNLEVAPLQVPGEEPLLVVVFTGQEMEFGGHPVEGEKKNSIAKDRRIKKLEEELTAARADMRSITHDQEAANEELQSANEEIISSNEELQSLNEELETSKEEIESTNEELITSNQELQTRIQQVEELHNYNETILETVHEPMLVLDKNIRIKSANKSFCRTFKIIEEDVIGQSLYKMGGHEWNIPRLRELLEEIVPKNNRFHDFEVELDFPVVGHKILLLNAHRIFQQSKNEELIVLTMSDATEVRKLSEAVRLKDEGLAVAIRLKDEELAVAIRLKEEVLLHLELTESKDAQHVLEKAVAERTAELKKQVGFSDAIIDTSPDVIVVYDQQMRVLRYNKTSAAVFNRPKEDILGKTLESLFPGEENGKAYHDIRRALNGEVVYEPNLHSPELGKYSEVFYTPLKGENGEVYAAMTIIRDITDLFESTEKVKQANTLLNERNLFVETLINASPDLIMVIDREMRFLTVNEKAANIFKDFYAGSVVGEKVAEVFPNVEKLSAFLNVNKVFESEKVFVHQEKSSHSEDWYEHSYVPLSNVAGEVYAIMVTSHNITAQVKTADEIRALNRTFNYAEQIGLVGSFEYNFSTLKMQFSDNLYRLLGCEPQEFEATIENYLKFVHPDDLEYALRVSNEAFVQKKASIREYRLVRKDGQTIYARSTGKNFTDNADAEWMVGTLQDITEATSQEAAKIEMYAAKIEAELKTKIAEDIVIAKQQFLSNMSHEIRTPMNAIIGFTNVILKTKLEARQKEYIHAIKESGDALLVLINDILDLAKVDSGKMTFEQTPFKLSSAVAAMLLLFEVKIQEKNITLIEEYDPAIPTILVGDPLRLRQIILNLVSNAVKFTNTGEISMQVRLLEEDAEKVTIEFTLTDTGIGIAEDKLVQVFNNFEQVYTEGGGAYGGTGLGLAIVKQLIERQGGTIRLESELGKGSTFSFVLSFEKTENEIENININENENENENIKVLVAEDVLLNQLLIKIIVEDFGFEVDIASNGKIAIEMLQKNRYDVVLMDLQMPEMNGFDATEYIRKQLNSQIPIIALTADVTTVDLEKCLASGMNDYISKPIDEKLLYSKIMKWVR